MSGAVYLARNGQSALLAADAASQPQLRFRPRLWSDLGAPVAPDRLIRGLLGERTLAVLYGDPGCGKSFLATDMALAVARGSPWMGRRTTPGHVLYVIAEGVGSFENRLLAYRRANPEMPSPPFATIGAAPNLGREGEDVEEVIAAARYFARDALALIVIDTLARTICGDENSPVDMGAFIMSCDRIRTATGATVLVVHHTPKEGNRPRGHTSLLGAVDTAVEIERRGAARVATIVKQKDGRDGETIGFDLEVIDLGNDDEGEPISSCIVVPADVEARSGKKRRRLTPAAQVALEVLRDLMARGVTVPHDGNDRIPAGRPLADEGAWRQACYERSISTGESEGAKRKAFGRAAQMLVAEGCIAALSGRVWLP